MKSKRNECIQVLRGIGALTVYIWHTHGYIDEYVNFKLIWLFKGFLANTFFFFLTAYFIGTSFVSSEIVTFKFVKNKLVKIYPLYCITTLFMTLTEIISGEPVRRVLIDELIPHMLLIRSWLPNYLYDGSLNGPGWFLSSLFFYWIITKWILKLIENIKDKKNRSWNYVFLIVCVGLILFSVFIPGDIYKKIPNAFQPEHILVYCLGMYIGCRNKTIKIIENHSLNVLICFVSSIVVLVISNLFDRRIGIAFFTVELFYVIPLVINKDDNFDLSNLFTRHFQQLGNVSFEFYMLHIPVITCLCAIRRFLIPSINGVEIFIFGYIITYIFSFIYKKITFYAKNQIRTWRKV